MTGILSGLIGSMKGATAPKTAPTSLGATPVNTSVAILFTAPSDDGGSPITNYEYSFNNSSWTALSPADAVSPITISGLTQNTGYSIFLRAVNAVGSGPASTAVSFTTQGVPSASIGGEFDKTESRVTITSGISANGSSTIVYIQYNTTNDFSAYTQVTAGTTSLQNATISSTVTGLPINTTLNGNGYLFYYRIVAVNSFGTTISTVSSWRSWGLREYNQRTPGTHYPVVPNVAGVIPAALPALYLIGGGGGGAWSGAGGGAGGLVSRFNVAFSGTSGALTVICGGGGAGGAQPNAGSPGGTSSFQSASLYYAAGGGGGGAVGAGQGGNVGSGDNPAYVGGTGATYSSGKNNYIAAGGGAGNDGNGGNGVATATGNVISGNGGPGNGFWGNAGGGGGGERNTPGANGSPYNIGAGGAGGSDFLQNGADGAIGIVYFTYYGP